MINWHSTLNHSPGHKSDTHHFDHDLSMQIRFINRSSMTNWCRESLHKSRTSDPNLHPRNLDCSARCSLISELNTPQIAMPTVSNAILVVSRYHSIKKTESSSILTWLSILKFQSCSWASPYHLCTIPAAWSRFSVNDYPSEQFSVSKVDFQYFCLECD
jgi:hypothetical protein